MPKQPRLVVAAGYGLVGGEEDVVRQVDPAADAPAGSPERLEFAVHGLVAQPGTVGQEQDVSNSLSLFELPDDLEGDLGLAGAGGQGEQQLDEARLAERVRINVVPMSGRFAIGPFDLELVTLTHSIPEPNGVVLRTPAGTVFHTGDWKFDPDPLIGPSADEAALGRLGEEGVLAMVCDSTNALRPGSSGSEADRVT